VRLHDRSIAPSFRPLDRADRLPIRKAVRGDGLSRDRKARIALALRELQDMIGVQPVHMCNEKIERILKVIEG